MPEEQRKPERPERQGSDNIVYVGKKSLMAYVLAVVTQFNAGSSEVRVKARGKTISRAIDITQVVKNRFMPTLQIKDFKAETEELPNEDGTTSKVSSLTLTLTK